MDGQVQSDSIEVSVNFQHSYVDRLGAGAQSVEQLHVKFSRVLEVPLAVPGFKTIATEAQASCLS